MMINPDFYGLNYISYKIISYSKPQFKQNFKFNLEKEEERIDYRFNLFLKIIIKYKFIKNLRI